MPALFGRSVVTRLFGIKRRSRALRHALEMQVIESARATERAGSPADAAHHEGARAAYLGAMANLAGPTPASAPGPPSDPVLRSAWERGFQAATKHAARLVDDVI